MSVACPSEGKLADRVTRAGGRHIPWEATRSPGRSVARETRRLAGILRENDANLIHLHSSKAGLAGRLALRGRRPTVFQPNGWSFLAIEGPLRLAATRWERVSARWADAVVCVSEGEWRAGERAGIQANWRVIENGVDLATFHEASREERRQARSRLGLPDAPLVVCVGRLCRQKGQDVLLEAWPQVRRRVPGAHLVLVGDGPERPTLERRADSSIRFAGEREDVAEWLGAASVVALPSRWEGMSFTMLEAMARGRSVVATDVSGVRDGLGGEAGAIVPVENPAQLAQALAERLSNAQKATQEGRAGRRRVVQRHDAAQISEAIATLYTEILRLRSTTKGRGA